MKLTTTVLKRIIAEELSKFNESKLFGDMKDVEDVDADEVDASDYADSLENPIDHYKALGLEETRLIHRLAQIHEAKKKAASKAAKEKMEKDKKKAEEAKKKNGNGHSKNGNGNGKHSK